MSDYDPFNTQPMAGVPAYSTQASAYDTQASSTSDYLRPPLPPGPPPAIHAPVPPGLHHPNSIQSSGHYYAQSMPNFPADPYSHQQHQAFQPPAVHPAAQPPSQPEPAAPAPPPPPPPPDLPPPPPPPLAATEEDPEERNERSRQIELENSKKRKMHSRGTTANFGVFTLTGKKAKAVSAKGRGGKVIKAFSIDSDDEGEGSTDTSPAAAKESTAESVTQGDPNHISDERKEEIQQTASWMAKNPDKQPVILEKSKDNPKFAFLFEPASAEGMFYQKLIDELKLEREVKSVCAGTNDLPSSTLQATIQEEVNRAAARAAAAAASVKPAATMVVMPPTVPQVAPYSEQVTSLSGKVKKNRWGPAATNPVPLEVIAQAMQALPGNGPKDDTPALPARLDDAARKQLEDQKQIQLLEQRIRHAAKSQLAGKEATGQVELHEERRKAYQELASLDDDTRDTIEDADQSGGVIEGGTWEHRKRAKEMLETADVALDLTLKSTGTHHLADFLPKAELDKFLKGAEARAAGEEAEKETFEKSKLDETNIGFKMLQKAGWKEGEGLGADASGIVDPVNVRKKGSETAGVGVKDTHEVEEGEDEVGQYRKRMMLAYRFRPNPLNNPRRTYY